MFCCPNPADIFIFKVSDRNTRTMYETCLKPTIKTPNQHLRNFRNIFWGTEKGRCFDVLIAEYSRCYSSWRMFKVNYRNTRTRSEICSKLTIKAPLTPCHWRRSGAFIVNFAGWDRREFKTLSCYKVFCEIVNKQKTVNNFHKIAILQILNKVQNTPLSHK